MRRRMRLEILSLGLLASACTLINENRLGPAQEELGCEPELSSCTTSGGEPGECRDGVCVPVDECVGDGCEVLDGPGVTTFSSHPGDKSGPFAEFAFSSTVATATFECALDSDTFEECTSPKSYTDLLDGPHVFKVRAVGEDDAREDPPLVHEWTVDSTVLDTFITSAPPATTGTSATFEFDGTLAARFECRLSPVELDFTACTSPKSYAGLAQRPTPGYTFEVRAVDVEDVPDPTPASRAFMVDAVGPTVTISGSPGPNATIERWDVNLTFSANEPVSTYRCALDQTTTFTNCTSYQRTGIRPGQHVLYVKAIDAYGNEGAVVTRSWTVAPRQITDIRTIRTLPIADGTYVRIDESYGTTATRITFVDHDYYERYWIQQTDGSASPANAGIMVYPYSNIPSDIGSNPVVTGVVLRDAYGETMLVDATHEYFNNTTFTTYGTYVDRDADKVRLPAHQGLLVSVGGDLRSGSGGCPGASFHFYTCDGINRVLCLDASFVQLPQPSGTTYLSLQGIPVWTSTGVQLLVLEWDDSAGSDVCL